MIFCASNSKNKNNKSENLDSNKDEELTNKDEELKIRHMKIYNSAINQYIESY